MRLDVRGLGVTVGDRVLLRTTNLCFFGGEVVALLGPSGSGKSTLLRALNGFRPGKGKVLLDRVDVYEKFDELKRGFGYVPQDDVLHQTLTVFDVLRYTALLRLGALEDAAVDHAIASVLREVELSDRAQVRVKSLSGGQRKRVSIAMELLTRPRLFFLDEPTSGLDPALEEKMMQLFRRLTTSERLTILTTHVLSSLEYVDLVVFVAGGHVVFVGPPQEATSFFEAEAMKDVYRRVSEKPASQWAAQFEQSRWHQMHVLDRLASLAHSTDTLPSTRAPGHRTDSSHPGAQTGDAAQPGRSLSAEEELARLKAERQRKDAPS